MAHTAFFVDDLGPRRVQSLVPGRLPLAVRCLFDRSTLQFPASLLSLPLRLGHLAATVSVYQLLVGKSNDSRSTYYEITADRLRRLLLGRE